MDNIIKSVLDNDMYKFTMQNAVIKLFPRAIVRFEFFNRGGTVFPKGFGDELRKQIDENMTKLGLPKGGKRFLTERCGRYLDPTYIDFLSGYRFDSSEVHIKQSGGDLQVIITGPWYRTILWEVPLMALISELFFKMTKQYPDVGRRLKNKDKAEKYLEMGIKFADFGTRRRYSFENHELVVKDLKEFGGTSMIGTSNVHLAMKYDLTPIGTHAHEWFMFHAAKYGFHEANRTGLDSWVQVYRGDLGIALSDTFTTDAFFRCFDTKFAKLFDGVRHDSGDAIEFAKKVIAHYNLLDIDPLSKTIVFSDGLNPKEVERIHDFCKGKVKYSYGIGTNFTNDVGVKALNMVIKMTSAKPDGTGWIPTIKLSDVEGKHTGDKEMIEIAKIVLNLK